MNLLSKLIRYGTIAAAIFGVVMIVLVSRSQAERQMPPPGDPPVMPPQKPYAHAVAATGILEALSENVAIGVPLPGLVTEVFVKVNEPVKKGQPLLKLDDRDLLAEQLSTQAQQEISRAQITVSQAQLSKLEGQLARLTAVSDTRAVSRQMKPQDLRVNVGFRLCNEYECSHQITSQKSRRPGRSARVLARVSSRREAAGGHLPKSF